MTALTDFLFPAPARRGAGAILRWWERRRLAYNAIVGGAGLLSMGAVGIIGSLPPNAPHMMIPPVAILAVGVMANFCYFLGPAVEVAVDKLSRGRVLPTGPVLYRMGLTFSVGLVSLPVLLVTFDWGFRLLRWMF